MLHSILEMKRTPAIRLQKCSDPSHVRIKKHNTRKPDIGLGILIFMQSRDVDSIIEYYGEYIGHGKSKTAFVLDHSGAEFHGKVLKVAKTFDMEPSIFTKASKHNLTTSILYNCHGVDDDTGCIYHCWITDRTIPLDDFCRKDGVSKSKCVLAAVYCLLNATTQGFYLSDCHFYNLGVVLNDLLREDRAVRIMQHSQSPW